MPESPDRIVALANGFKPAMAVLSAVELDLFTALGDDAVDIEELRARIGIAARGARDFFDALVALGLLVRDADGRYANTAETASYLDRRKPGYMGGELNHLNSRVYALWHALPRALRTGQPQDGVAASAHFPTLFSDEATLDNFVRAMTAAALPVAAALAERFAWRDYRSFLDIGTSQGCVPVRIVQKHAHIAGVGFDLPHLKPLFDRYVAQHGLSNRLRFVAGDVFTDSLPTADVVVLGRVLHNWDLPAKQRLLRKAHEALPSGGAVIVHEHFIDDDRRVGTVGLLASLNMLIMTAGGFDFSVADCKAWMAEAGFHHMRVEPLAAGQAMVVGRKP